MLNKKISQLSSGSGGGGNSTKGDSDLAQFQEQLLATADLLRDYREVAGKDNDELVEDIIKSARKLWNGQSKGSNCIALGLCFGADVTASKLLSSLGDFSINSALFLSFLTPYLFETPEAIMQSHWSKVGFNLCLWMSFTSFLIVINFMIFVNSAMNNWIREIDLLKTFHKHGWKIEQIPRISFSVGVIGMVGAIAIAQIKTYNVFYAIFPGVALAVFFLASYFPGEEIHNPRDMNAIYAASKYFGVDPPDGEKEFGHEDRKQAMIDWTRRKSEIVADVLDTPVDVLREQSRLAKVLDNDAWRQRSLSRNSITASTKFDDEGDERSNAMLVAVRPEGIPRSKSPTEGGNERNGGRGRGRGRGEREVSAASAGDEEDEDEQEDEDGAKVAALTEALNRINPALGRYAATLAKEHISPELLPSLAADRQLCMSLGVSAGHALLLSADRASISPTEAEWKEAVNEDGKKLLEDGNNISSAVESLLAGLDSDEKANGSTWKR